MTLTVLASGGEAELYLTFERAPHRLPRLGGLAGTIPAAAQWQAAMDVAGAGPGCLEIRWRRSPVIGVPA